MKGIVLSGGTGTRLFPLTIATSKQLLPVADKPMIYYPISTLLSMGIRDILIITTPDDLKRFQLLLDDGTQLGVHFSYAVQEKPIGIAQALSIGEDFINGESVSLILGDNLFLGETITQRLLAGLRLAVNHSGAVVFAKEVEKPERFGVIEFDENGDVRSIEEKPSIPKSRYCITGLYIFDYKAVKYANALKPSRRNELEITDVLIQYAARGDLRSVRLSNNEYWLDAGTHEAYLDASFIVRKLERDLQISIGSPEIISYSQGWIDKKRLLSISEKYQNNQYGLLLQEAANSEELIKLGYNSHWRSGVYRRQLY